MNFEYYNNLFIPSYPTSTSNTVYSDKQETNQHILNYVLERIKILQKDIENSQCSDSISRLDELKLLYEKFKDKTAGY